MANYPTLGLGLLDYIYITHAQLYYTTIDYRGHKPVLFGYVRTPHLQINKFTPFVNSLEKCL